MKIRCYTLLLAVMTAAASLCYGDITLARNGKALYTIVERPDAARLEKAAVKDLKLYLDKITGGDFKIVSGMPPWFSRMSMWVMSSRLI